MSQDPKQLILQVLDIIGYENNKEQFANIFLSTCIQKALNNLLNELPKEIQFELIKRANLTSSENMEKLLQEYFPNEKISQAIKEATSLTFKVYLLTIFPTLLEDQNTKLKQYLSSQVSATV